MFETTEGRAEVLLSPGSYLRLAENSVVRLTYERHWEGLRLEHVRGLIVIQCDKLSGKIIVTANGSTISLLERGIYEIGGEPAIVKVSEGKARVTREGRAETVKRSTLLALDGLLLRRNSIPGAVIRCTNGPPAFAGVGCRERRLDCEPRQEPARVPARHAGVRAPRSTPLEFD